MSTKIFTGFALAGTTIEATLGLLGRQRGAIQALVDTKNCKEVARQATRTLDGYCVARPNGGPYPEALEEVKRGGAFWHAAQNIETEQHEGRKRFERHPLTDCDVLLRLFLDFETNRVLGFACEERVGVLEHLLEVPGIVPFSYWNNTDPDETVSPEDWEQRGILWERVFTQNGGCEFSMTWEPQFPQFEKVVPHLPSFEERLESRSRDAALDAYVNANWVQTEPGSTKGLFPALSAGRKALDDPGSEARTEYLAAKDRLKRLLLTELVPHLKTPLAELPAN